jgi:hypothetical protein
VADFVQSGETLARQIAIQPFTQHDSRMPSACPAKPLKLSGASTSNIMIPLLFSISRTLGNGSSPNRQVSRNLAAASATSSPLAPRGVGPCA